MPLVHLPYVPCPRGLQLHPAKEAFDVAALPNRDPHPDLLGHVRALRYAPLFEGGPSPAALRDAHPPPSCHPSQVVVALGAIDGTHNAGLLSSHGFVESSVETTFYALRVYGKVRAVLHTHIDDFLFANDTTQDVADKIDSIKRALQMNQHPADRFTCRGIIITTKSDSYVAEQARALAPRFWWRTRPTPG